MGGRQRPARSTIGAAQGICTPAHAATRGPNQARALELDLVTALPVSAMHARACRVVADIMATATADPSISAVRVIDGDHRALGRDRWSAWALAAARRRPYADGEAARFDTVQQALHQAQSRLRQDMGLDPES